MAFEDSGWVPIKPITLLFGQNSSGKSSILKALMFLKQSTGAQRLTLVSEYGVDLGSYTNIVHGLSKTAYLKSKKRLSFGFKVPISLNLLHNTDFASQTATLNIDFGWNPNKKAPDIVAFEITLLPDDITIDEYYFKVEIEDYSDTDANSNLIFETNIFDDKTKINKTDIWEKIQLKTIYGFMPLLDIAQKEESDEKSKDWEFVNRILIQLRRDIREFLETILYVKPVRPDPERLFVINNLKQEELKRQGFSSFLKFLNQGYANAQQENALDTWAQHLGLGQKIRVKKYSNIPGSSIISEVVVTSLSGQIVNLADIGFGVSQVLPVLIECLFSESGATVLVQQPELHLHPAAQAELGDLFITSLADMSKTYILETHSEHLVLRLQRRVRNTLISQDSISVNYIARDKKKSTCIHIRMNNKGEFIDEWPNGFFEEGYREVFGN